MRYCSALGLLLILIVAPKRLVFAEARHKLVGKDADADQTEIKLNGEYLQEEQLESECLQERVGAGDSANAGRAASPFTSAQQSVVRSERLVHAAEHHSRLASERAQRMASQQDKSTMAHLPDGHVELVIRTAAKDGTVITCGGANVIVTSQQGGGQSIGHSVRDCKNGTYSSQLLLPNGEHQITIKVFAGPQSASRCTCGLPRGCQ